MKLRLNGDSLRLRVAPSELERLMRTGRVEEITYFGQDSRFTYALECAEVGEVTVRAESMRVRVILPTAAARAWAGGDDVGVYGSVAVATGRLEVAVEKDWACLDKSDSDNKDTFPNPNQGSVC